MERVSSDHAVERRQPIHLNKRPVPADARTSQIVAHVSIDDRKMECSLERTLLRLYKKRKDFAENDSASRTYPVSIETPAR